MTPIPCFKQKGSIIHDNIGQLKHAVGFCGFMQGMVPGIRVIHHLMQNPVDTGDNDHDDAVKGLCQGIVEIGADKPCGVGHKRGEEQENQIPPKDRAGNRFHLFPDAVHGDPYRTEPEKRQPVRKIIAPQRLETAEGELFRFFQFQYQNGHDDGQNRIGECKQSFLFHRSSFHGRPGKQLFLLPDGRGFVVSPNHFESIIP